MGSFFRFIFKNGFKNIFRNVTLSFFTTVTITLTLSLLGVLLVTIDAAEQIMDNLLDSQQLEVYFTDTATESRIKFLIDEATKDERVSEVTYIDKAAALARFRDMLGDDESLLSGYTPDKHPFPASIQITMKDAEDVEDMVAYMEGLDGVRSVSYSREFTRWINSTGNKITLASTVIIIAVGIAAMLLIGSSIRVSIYSRRDELKMMRLIGANNAYIQGPFVLEGIILAIFGSIAACIIVDLVSNAVLGNMGTGITFMNIGYYYNYDRVSLMSMVCGICSVASILMGIIASVFSTLKYIKD